MIEDVANTPQAVNTGEAECPTVEESYSNDSAENEFVAPQQCSEHPFCHGRHCHRRFRPHSCFKPDFPHMCKCKCEEKSKENTEVPPKSKCEPHCCNDKRKARRMRRLDKRNKMNMARNAYYAGYKAGLDMKTHMQMYQNPMPPFFSYSHHRRPFGPMCPPPMSPFGPMCPPPMGPFGPMCPPHCHHPREFRGCCGRKFHFK